MKEFFTKLALSIAAVFAPVSDMMLGVLILLLADLVTGVVAARKRGETVTSAGLHRTVVKLLVYEGAIALTFLTQKLVLKDFTSVLNIVGGYLALTQLVSVFENLNEIAGKNLLDVLINKLKSKNDK